jgi:hypothetical protein
MSVRPWNEIPRRRSLDVVATAEFDEDGMLSSLDIQPETASSEEEEEGVSTAEAGEYTRPLFVSM